MIYVVTDSTSDVPAELALAHHLISVPAIIMIGNMSYRDGVDLSRTDFYQMLPTLQSTPATAHPAPSAFLRAYVEAADQGADGVLSIHAGSALSGMVNAAQMAALDSPIPVTVIDSGQVSLGMGLMILEICRALESGYGLNEAAQLARDLGAVTYSFALPETLIYLQRGGRLSTLQAHLGALLQIKPLITLHLNTLRTERLRTSSRAINRMLEHVEELAPIREIAVMHSAALSGALALREKLSRYVPTGTTILCQEVATILGAHVGPGALGVALIQNR